MVPSRFKFLSKIARSSRLWAPATDDFACKRLLSNTSGNPSRSRSATSTQDSINNNSQDKSTGSFSKLVGYPSPLLGLSGHLLGSELKQLPTLVQKLLSSRHPVVTKSDHLLQTSNPSSSYSLGLLTLLVSKSMNILNPSLPNLDQFGITSNQRTIAEVTEMVNMGHMVQSEIVNIQQEQVDDSHYNDNDALVKDIEFGNKLLLIGGDLLLARACKELALLYNPKVVGLISQAISDLMTGVCLRPNSHFPSVHMPHSAVQSSSGPVSNRQSLPDPSNEFSSDTSSVSDSLYDSYFHNSSLLSNSCKCCVIMAELDQHTEALAANIGRHLGIAQQVVNDFVHIQKTQTTFSDNLLSIADESITKALNFLDLLPPTKSKDALTEIVSNMRTHIYTRLLT